MPVETDPLPSYDELSFPQLYRDFTYDYPTYSSVVAFRRGFIRKVAKTTSQPELLNDVKWCYRCTYPMRSADSTLINGLKTRAICNACVPNFTSCGSCNELYRSGTMNYVMGHDNQVCGRCIRAHYRYCNECDGYFNRADRAEHDHSNASCCGSPATKFKVQNNGSGLLRNDKKVHVSLPAGEISEEGVEAIRSAVHNMYYESEPGDRTQWLKLAAQLKDLGNQWQTRDGNYPKRLSRYAYKKYGLKVPPKLMTQVGNIARDHSTAVDFTIAVTRMLNKPARDFGHPESCWWSSYSTSRCVLKTNGGFGLRSFNANKRVSGRAWVIPLKKTETGGLTPTFETEKPAAFIIFNGYGDMQGYTAARIVSYMNGMTYRKVEFSGAPMYINSSSGYLVGPDEVVEPYTDGSFGLSFTKHSNLFDTESRVLANA